MTISQTTRFDIYRWSEDSDAFTRSQMDTSHQNIEERAARFESGTTLPAANAQYARTFFYETDAQILYYYDAEDGSGSWVAVAEAPGSQTGTGAAVFATSPTLVTPNLGTPSALTLTNATGLPITGITSSTSAALGIGTLELGNASDTTLSRSSAGRLAVEGVNVVTVSSTDTLTNKTLTAPVISTISNTGTVTLPTATDTLVGRATTDTLTNKSIALGSNTVTGTLAQFNTAVTDADLVSLAGSETLTNKTLTSPVLTSASSTALLLNHAKEVWNVQASAAGTTVNLSVLSGAAWFYTTNSTSNWTLNVRGDASTTLNSLMSNGESMTVAFAATNGATAYRHTALTIDGSAATVRWQGGTSPSLGNANSVDIYAFTIVKTANATFSVFGSQVRFA